MISDSDLLLGHEPRFNKDCVIDSLLGIISGGRLVKAMQLASSPYLNRVLDEEHDNDSSLN